MGLLRLILIILIIYFIFKFLVRYIFPFLLTSYVNKKMEEMNQGRSDNFKAQKRREGEVNIDFTTTNQKQTKNNSGEYVDYEEIKD